MLKRLKLIFLLFICPVFLFAQEIIKNADGSISVISGTMIYLDSSGNLLDEIQFQDSLKTGKYAVIIKQKQSSIENRLKKKKSLDSYPELQLGNVLPITELVDLYQNKINVGKKTELTLLSFWDITCLPCIEELIVFNILANEYPEVNFIAITATSKQNVNSFFQEKGIEWKNLAVIPDCQEYFEKFKILNFPLSVIIDKNSIIKNVFVGKSIREILISFEDLIVKGTMQTNDTQ